MKIKLFILTVFSFFSFSVFSQNTYTWTGNGDNTTFTDVNNWDNTGFPNQNDTIIFNNGEDIHISNIPQNTISMQFGRISVENSTNVFFNGANTLTDIYTSELFVEGNSSLHLEGTNTIFVYVSEGHIFGKLDAGDIHGFGVQTSGTIYFEENSFFETANTSGFDSSITGVSFINSESFTLRYYGDNSQNAGLLNLPVTDIGEIIVDNTVNVELDNNISVNTLSLNSGNFNIASYSLTVFDAINYQDGLLAGNNASFLIIGNGSAGSGDSFFVNFDPSFNALNTLTVDRPGEITEIESELTIGNQLNILGGLLKIYSNLNLSSSASVNASHTDYIVTENDAYVKASIAALVTDTIPVGTVNSYAPAIINASSAEIFSVSVHDGIFSEGNYGIPLNRNVDLCWEILPASTTSFELTLAWDPVVQSAGFDFANSYISNYNGTEWDNIGMSAGSTDAGLNTQTRSAISSDGFFGVFSGTNNLPVASDNEIYISMNQVYTFSQGEFNYSDVLDGDDFAKIMIIQQPVDGNLFLDYDGNNLIDGSDLILTAGDQVLTEEIINGYLKYEPVLDAVNITESYTFAVSDGIQYSSGDYVMTINITDNRPPEVLNQTFTIPEHSPNGTVVGKIEASDPDGNNIFFYPQENAGYSDAFILADDGTITVNNTNLLEYSLNPSFEYNIDVCDDGQPILCTQIRVTINLEEVIRELIPANFISPNGDGYNDRWFVLGLENDVYEVTIFNSNGKLLFHSSDYKNGWDGTSRGRRLPPGVYYYLLRSSNTELKGTITLVR